jgi:hypothetical protein
MKYKLKKLSKPNSTSEIINCIKDILNWKIKNYIICWV